MKDWASFLVSDIMPSQGGNEMIIYNVVSVYMERRGKGLICLGSFSGKKIRN